MEDEEPINQLLDLVDLVVVQQIIREVVDQVLEQQIKDMLAVKVLVTRQFTQLVAVVEVLVLLERDIQMDQIQVVPFQVVEMVETV